MTKQKSRINKRKTCNINQKTRINKQRNLKFFCLEFYVFCLVFRVCLFGTPLKSLFFICNMCNIILVMNLLGRISEFKHVIYENTNGGPLESKVVKNKQKKSRRSTSACKKRIFWYQRLLLVLENDVAYMT